MKLKNIFLLGIVSSIMAYLNNNLEFSEDKRGEDDVLFEDIKTLVASKLAEFDIDEKLKDLSSDQPEDIDAAQKMAKDMTNDLLHDLDKTLNNYNDGIKPITETKEEFSYDDLLKELEALLSDVEEPKKEEKIQGLAPFKVVSDEERFKYSDESSGVFKVEAKPDIAIEEDPYLAQIQEAINSAFSEAEAPKKEEETQRDLGPDEIDDLFSEIMNEGKEEEKQEDDEDYIDELVSELEGALGELNDLEVDETKDIYAQIRELYPYLSQSFIRAVYDLKEAIALEYPLNKKVIVLHRLDFDDLDNLRQFTEIVLSHGYRVNVDERQGIVDILKEFVNTDGKILTNIFEIANQARLLHGEYEGYRVDVVE